MKIGTKSVLFIGILILLVTNIVLFAKGIVMADTAQKIQITIERLKIENNQLQTKLYSSSSLDKLDKTAQSLGFTKIASPLYLENPRYAQAQ
ncbi:hypothetical protein A3D80_00260 [Candidatus Roizmanbacteria bacterium RIFCSPHIGHO2_02_FULL_40_13b]|uniref:Uncharacterized protein n=1 Tax=Candidatus Roizmanbacteria bacterium RIFCSPHIGHO2_01_FULL_39_24 TaxID=1802032 RepID=A0A1F7GK62_9BACT|nr:MAG: hypothetical protein A2799_00460 [Candidatus Roizmanbacteria bacterium RIFCSPHIGHO2_01_FULL_39_24]OGK28068.1 MAG: hypothetical protein A3D80_00260 [Candidatus Roizmanbacteria bacterium RIFCSPHIGHO2_02_FULL_40_13b]OGK49577.1 MAG: hypothetical protein A3A56_04230 [Candidatus Roizmanbacteria bacterium RIFCSPLOWO2_01_FULL_40_32]OGK57027.1 MAG: hypothetical protein A3H83_00895 [Candidatus Roizmanbacteria bacterium RIFCSPLOWO2_02_FULL_39_8]